jgi:phospholipid N-methyltransferase
MLGSLIPSSRFLIDEVLQEVDWARARVIVEYGPGVGSMTEPILARMHPDARLVVFETNPQFVAFLRKSYPDPRLTVVNGSADDVDGVLTKLGHERAHYIVSGIPFSTIPAGIRESILLKSHAVLAPDGMLIVYQFTRAVRPDLERIFGQVEQRFELLNVLPAHLFLCERNAA